jgi:peroxiredoxin
MRRPGRILAAISGDELASQNAAHPKIAVRKRYGVPNTFGLIPGWVTYVEDEVGVVRHIFTSQLGVEKHVEEALEALDSVRSENAS